MKKGHLVLAILITVVFASLAVFCIVKRHTIFVIPCIGIAAASAAFLMGSSRKNDDF